jgi:hypothetical protein
MFKPSAYIRQKTNFIYMKSDQLRQTSETQKLKAWKKLYGFSNVNFDGRFRISNELEGGGGWRLRGCHIMLKGGR